MLLQRVIHETNNRFDVEHKKKCSCNSLSLFEMFSDHDERQRSICVDSLNVLFIDKKIRRNR